VERLRGRRIEGDTQPRTNKFLDAMPASMRRGERVDYVVVERDGVDGGREAVGIEIGKSTSTKSRVSRRTRVRRQAPSPVPTDIESDDESDLEDLLEDIHATPTSRPFTIPSATPAVRLMGHHAQVNIANLARLYHRLRTAFLPTRVPLKVHSQSISHLRNRPRLANAKGESRRRLNIYLSLLVQSVRYITTRRKCSSNTTKGRPLLLLCSFWLSTPCASVA
jgi:hypothetical protein